ncbi:penicillin-binding protein 1A [Bathymodiolus platifrons methanotrophic gill symbiont]|uniref:penicillin-binding protein 1A n=1 Tax=Bathymodiolus platifrons methanotrophic gill symbiont TaxID=113268 RepID=UPI000B422430|nr:penicillin-binding protein 1A [Bathymodiolus platifrons methanotrophic gill symbiont]GAW87025.1 penicillin-binding protein 1A [Bathymodiolus platifrons methanotrophic gill symbiont]GFO74616.1 penicillin-binding protein 1A [Bathymodiolus platifrons methanotrophic gill symbiont]
MRILKWTLAALLTFSILGVIIGYFAYQQLSSELPDIKVLRNIQYKQPLNIYSQDGLLIEQFGERIRNPISISDTPKQLINAFIAAEDGAFYSHFGIDFKGLTRAVIQLVLTGKKKQGGSTITMQVARNFLLNNKKTYTRKFKEIILSIQIEQEFSKNEILELYLNKIYLGQRAYGIAAASEIYYDRPLTQLTLAELGMIAGLPKAPSRYNPIANPQRALIRRNYVLSRMLDSHYINQQEYNSAIAALITANSYTTQRELYAPYIAEMVRNEILNLYDEDTAYTTGLKVYTTLKSDLQNIAVTTLRSNLHQFDERHSYRINKKQKLPLKSSYNTGATFPAQVTQINKQQLSAKFKDGTTITLLWEDSPWSTKYTPKTQKKETINSYLDIIDLDDTIRVRQQNKKWRLAQIPQAESAFVALDPKNGAVLALSGGYAYFNNKYNRATQAKRQPGSGFKPIIYTSALEYGYTSASMINDAPIVSSRNPAEESAWRPENYSHKFYGPTSLRTALRKSRNLIAIRLTRSIGIPAITDTALRFGFQQKQLPQKLSLALGSGYASPLQMARMYSVFANGGFLITPHFIDRIESNTGEILFQAEPLTACPYCENSTAPRIISEQINFLMNSLLRDVVQRGTAVKAKSLQRSDLAGKTGTTNDQKDAWFNGFTPDIVGIAWVGQDNSKSLGRWETGGKAALPMWIDFMRYALKDTIEEELIMPEGMSKVLIDPETGLLAREESPLGSWEYFRDEFIPTELTLIDEQDNELNDEQDITEQVAPEVLF